MDSLPSFVDLMDSLTLEPAKQAPSADHSLFPQPASPAVGWKNGHTRSSSSPSLREVTTSPYHVSRYSPYSSALSPTRQRRSLSPVSSSSDFESCPASPLLSRRRPRKIRNKRPHGHYYDSSSDLTADTPISTYVRRKTPGTSPTSPTFNRDSGYESSSSSSSPAMPFSIPSLPVLLPNSSSSEALPNTHTSDAELEDVRASRKSRVKRISKSSNGNCRIVRRPTGVRISVPPYPTNLGERSTDLRSF